MEKQEEGEYRQVSGCRIHTVGNQSNSKQQTEAFIFIYHKCLLGSLLIELFLQGLKIEYFLYLNVSGSSTKYTAL